MMAGSLIFIFIVLVLAVLVAEWPKIFVFHVLLKSGNVRAVQEHSGDEQHEGSEWRAILGVPPGERNIVVVKKAYRRKARTLHPDRGGSNLAMSRINEAYRCAKDELDFN